MHDAATPTRPLRFRLRAALTAAALTCILTPPCAAAVGTARHAEVDVFSITPTSDGVRVTASARYEAQAIEIRLQSRGNETASTRTEATTGEVHEFLVDVALDDAMSGRLYFSFPPERVTVDAADGSTRVFTPPASSVTLPADALRAGTILVRTSAPGIVARHFYLSRRFAFNGTPVAHAFRLLGRPWTGRISLHDSHGCELAALEVHLASDPAQSRIAPK